MSLRLRLVLALAPVFVLGLLAADIATYTMLDSFLVSRVDAQLLSAHQGVAAALGVRSGPGVPGAVALPPYTYGEIRTPQGSVIVSRTFTFRGQDASTHPQLAADLQPGTPEHPNFVSVDGSGHVGRYRAYVDTADDGAGDLLIVAVPLDDVESTMTRLLLLEIGVTGGATLIVGAATWLLVRRGLRPLARMGDTARAITAGELSRRVTPSGEHSEVARLGLALNTMLDRLEAAFAERAAQEQRLRHFVSDASHELRTPLTSMQGYAELLQRPDLDREDVMLAMRRMEDETRRMGVLVDDLLLLARLDQGRPLERRSVDLEALVRDAGADARAVDPGRAVSVRVDAPLLVVGDEMRLRQVLGNIVRNAVVHTPAGTPIEITLRPAGDLAVVEIVDHGPGIPPGHAERIFNRFHRADPMRSGDRGGSGLGLSIAAAVVSAHGGRITVRDTPDGGATFRIELPADGAQTGEAPGETEAEEELAVVGDGAPGGTATGDGAVAGGHAGDGRGRPSPVKDV